MELLYETTQNTRPVLAQRQMKSSSTNELMYASSDGTQLYFLIKWFESTYASLFMCLNPDFYFYKLLHDLIPLKQNQYHFPVTAEKVKSWLVEKGFLVDQEVVEVNTYTATFYRNAMNLNLNHFKRTWPEVQKLASHLQNQYTGNVYVRVNFSPNDTEVELRFNTVELKALDLTERLPLHQFSIGDLVFSDSQP